MATTNHVENDPPTESSEEKTPAPPPASSEAHIADEGVSAQGWLQIFSTFMAFFNTWYVPYLRKGIQPGVAGGPTQQCSDTTRPLTAYMYRGLLLTFGVFQTHYEKVILAGQPSSNISWISTTGAFLTLSAGIFAGPLFDHGFYRALLIGGSHLQVFGLMMLSLSTRYYQLFLCQAVCVGVGAGIAFTPSVAASVIILKNPATRAKAMGLVACGSSIGPLVILAISSVKTSTYRIAGGIIYPVMFRYLVPQIGFAWTVRSIAFIVWGLYIVSFVALLGHQPKPLAYRRLFDTSALTDLPFMTLCIASVSSATAYYVPSIYLPLVTYERINDVGTAFGYDLLTILNGSSIAGRLLAGFAAAVYGPTETTCVCLVFGSILLFSWSAVDNLAGTIAWSVFWGMVSGVIVALPGAFVPLFCPSLAVVGTRSGMYWVFVGIGMLIGSPIGGAIWDGREPGSGYWQLQVFAGVFMMVAAILTLYPITHLRRKQRATASN